MEKAKSMIQKLLIANRGEIAVRIIRACRNLGIKAVAVYSEPDRDALFVRMADEAFFIGPANPVKSYLNIDALIGAAKESGADAVHPGYGFLSENALFADAVDLNGFTWVGPSAVALRIVESKCACRRIADDAGIPVIPGTLNPVKDVQEIIEFAKKCGYPVFVKLDKGGGGKGLEIMTSASDASAIYEKIGRIGQIAFSCSDCYVEKAFVRPRHIEVQFIADESGNVVCLGERECSVQRRHQKIIEESPSVIVTDEDRERLFDYTVRLVKAMKYKNAGTMEFLRSQSGDYHFMEVNARLQVEHPVTELVSGIDIVEAQIKIAGNERFEIIQDDVKLDGHAIEARVYAEDPFSFKPSPGTIHKIQFPEQGKHLRIDHALEENCKVPAFYDPLLAKVIAWNRTRPEALSRLLEAMQEFVIEGILTTIPTNIRILEDYRFKAGEIDTRFISDLFGADRYQLD